MLVDYPMEWRKYMIKGKTRTFSKNTPLEIVRKRKKLIKWRFVLVENRVSSLRKIDSANAILALKG